MKGCEFEDMKHKLICDRILIRILDGSFSQVWNWTLTNIGKGKESCRQIEAVLEENQGISAKGEKNALSAKFIKKFIGRAGNPKPIPESRLRCIVSVEEINIPVPNILPGRQHATTVKINGTTTVSAT